MRTIHQKVGVTLRPYSRRAHGGLGVVKTLATILNINFFLHIYTFATCLQHICCNYVANVLYLKFCTSLRLIRNPQTGLRHVYVMISQNRLPRNLQLGITPIPYSYSIRLREGTWKMFYFFKRIREYLQICNLALFVTNKLH